MTQKPGILNNAFMSKLAAEIKRFSADGDLEVQLITLVSGRTQALTRNTFDHKEDVSASWRSDRL
jgi:hypothetical protein